MKKQGILTIISGFSGAGKGTVVKEIMKKYPESYYLSISATTRSPREGEAHGEHYFFVSKEEFEQMIEEHELLEYARYVDNYYGTPRKVVLDHLEQGVHVILEIEMQGALKVKKKYPEALMIFVAPPDAKTLETRLRGRGTEAEETIIKRLKRACAEAVYMNDYDYIVVNADNAVDACAEQIHQIILNQQQTVGRSAAFIQDMSEELKSYANID